MGKNKKTPANAFYYYMLNYKQKQGKSFKSMKDVADAAGVHWQNMNPEQRRPYEEIAKRERNGGIKYTSINESIDTIQKIENDKLERENKMKNDIKMTVARNLDLGRLSDTSFYLIHVNEFGYSGGEKRHYPAEIAVLRFNLNYGVLNSNIYHAITKPGRFPLGFASTAIAKCNESHQLPIPHGDECNLDKIMNELHQFIKVDYNVADSSYPPLYVAEKDFELVDNVLNNLCDDYGYARDHFKLYQNQHLLYYLRNREAQVWPSVSNAVLELERDSYYYTIGIGCEFHETSEIGYHCSLSYVVRTAFVICDCVCPEMGITLIPGQHVPANSEAILGQLQQDISRSSSVASGTRYRGYDEESMCEFRSGGEASSVRSGITGHSRDKTTYSVASSVCNEFVDYDTEDAVSQANEGKGWSEVNNSRHNKRRLQTQYKLNTSVQTKASVAGSSDTLGISGLSQITTGLSQDTIQSAESLVSAKNTSQSMRRPTSMSVAQQFKNIKLPSSSVATIGSTGVSGSGSITKGRGRASLIFNNN